MNKTSSKRYVVRAGKSTGIFNNRADCQKSVSGFKDAQYKSFKSKEDATIAFSRSYNDYKGKKTTGKVYTQSEKNKIGLPITSSISVDAACSGNPGILEFRGVITETKKEIFSFGPYPNGTVNIGEFLALIEGLKYSITNNQNLIYTDSRTAMSRIRNNKVNTTLMPTMANSHLFVSLDEATERFQKNLKLGTFNKDTIEVITLDLKSIHIKKRETALRGEIPADYDRK